MKEAIPSRRMRAAVVARLAATEVGTSTQMGQRMVNGDTHLAGGMGRCPPPGGGAHGGNDFKLVRKVYRTPQGRRCDQNRKGGGEGGG